MQLLLKVFSMFKIGIFYDETIGIEYASESAGIMCINYEKHIGCSLYNQTIEDFTNKFSNGVATCWLILDHQIKQIFIIILNRTVLLG